MNKKIFLLLTLFSLTLVCCQINPSTSSLSNKTSSSVISSSNTSSKDSSKSSELSIDSSSESLSSSSELSSNSDSESLSSSSTSSEIFSSSETPTPIKPKTKYITNYTYHTYEWSEFINKTLYTYENDFKLVTREIVTNQNEESTDKFHTMFKDIYEYNDQYQLVKETNFDFLDFEYQFVTEYEYNPLGLVSSYVEYESVDKEELRKVGKDTFTYNEAGILLSHLEYGSSGNLKEKEEYEYLNGYSLSKHYDKDFKDMTEPDQVIKKKTEIDLIKHEIVITSSYLVYEEETLDEELVFSIDTYKFDNLIVHEDYNYYQTYSYNENNDPLVFTDRHRNDDWSKEYSSIYEKRVIYDTNNYLSSYNEYSIDGNEEIITNKYVYTVDEDGYVTSETAYLGNSETPSFVCSYELSTLTEKISPNLVKFEGYGVGRYNSLLEF